MPKKGYLILENGDIYEGDSFSIDREIAGEVVFNTGMVGYPEGFTDPSYYGQILVATYPLIGNYGVPPAGKSARMPENFESDRMQISGLVVSRYEENKSHYQAKEVLASWMKREKVPGLSGIDTRSLTKTLRTTGVMKGLITFQKPPDKFGGFSFKDINRENLVPFVSCRKPEIYGNGRLRVLFIDCGLKYNQIRLMLNYDTTVIRVPWNYNPYQEKKPPDFDTVFISNGPGDARTMPETVETVRQSLAKKIPTFGICLGHQIMALAAGGDIYKLKYGHRSQNQPVRDVVSGKCFITSQNHGYSVVEKSIPKDWQIWFTNLNDGTNEGIRHKKLPFFCVQFHPEASPGPTDTNWLFDYYFRVVKKWL